jgi:hypothetical protein
MNKDYIEKIEEQNKLLNKLNSKYKDILSEIFERQLENAGCHYTEGGDLLNDENCYEDYDTLFSN